MSRPAGRTGPAAAHALRLASSSARPAPSSCAAHASVAELQRPWPRRGQRPGRSPAAGRRSPRTMCARHRPTGEPVRPHLPTGTPIRARQAGCPRPDAAAQAGCLGVGRERQRPAAQPVSRSARRRPAAAASDRSRPASAGFSSIRAPQTGGYRRPAQPGSMKSQSPGWRRATAGRSRAASNAGIAATDSATGPGIAWWPSFLAGDDQVHRDWRRGRRTPPAPPAPSPRRQRASARSSGQAHGCPPPRLGPLPDRRRQPACRAGWRRTAAARRRARNPSGALAAARALARR